MRKLFNVIALVFMLSVSAYGKTAQEHLATYQMSVDDGWQFVKANLHNPRHIFDMCFMYGIDNDMLAEIVSHGYGTAVDTKKIVSFFAEHGIDSNPLGFKEKN